MKEKIIIRKYKKGDEDKLINFYNSIFPNKIDIDFWKWKYLQSPLKSIILIAFYKEEVIGHIGNQLKKGIIFNKEIIFSSSYDVAVKEEYRGQQIIGRLMKDSVIAKPFISISFPKKETLQLHKRYRFYDIAFDSPIFVKTFGIKHKILKKFKRNNSTNLSVRKMDFSKKDFNLFWKEKSKELDLSIIRDWDFVKWRIINSPKNYGIFLIKNKEKIVGYFSLLFEKNAAYIVDILVLENYLGKNIINLIENKCIGKCKELKVLTTDKNLTKLFRNNGYKFADSILTFLFSNLENCKFPKPYLTFADTDVF